MMTTVMMMMAGDDAYWEIQESEQQLWSSRILWGLIVNKLKPYMSSLVPERYYAIALQCLQELADE
jgi:hypothetical protein